MLGHDGHVKRQETATQRDQVFPSKPGVATQAPSRRSQLGTSVIYHVGLGRIRVGSGPDALLQAPHLPAASWCQLPAAACGETKALRARPSLSSFAPMLSGVGVFL